MEINFWFNLTGSLGLVIIVWLWLINFLNHTIRRR